MGVWARRACKNLGPPIYFCNVEASNFKFGIQLGLGEELAKKTFTTKIGGGPG